MLCASSSLPVQPQYEARRRRGWSLVLFLQILAARLNSYSIKRGKLTSYVSKGSVVVGDEDDDDVDEEQEGALGDRVILVGVTF